MKNSFQRETVNEVISRIDEFQPLSRRQWGMEVVVSDGRLLSTRWENWRSGWNRTLSSTVRTHSRQRRRAFVEKSFQDRGFFLWVA